ncbi:MAG: hypothetical protein R6V58_18400 [Planctomycetota bacterium]
MRTVASLLIVLLLAPAACAADQAARRPEAGPAPNPRLANLAPNTVLDLGPLKLLPPEGESRGRVARITDYSTMVYDAHGHRVLMFGGGHATTFTDAIYAFDFETLAWKALYPPTPHRLMKPANFDAKLGAWKKGPKGPYPRPLSRHTYDMLCVPDDLNEFIVLKYGGGTAAGVDFGAAYFGGQAAHYDLEKGEWSFAKTGCPHGYATSAYDPVSKKIIVMQNKLGVYDPFERKGRTVESTPGQGYANHMVYYPPNQKMYYFIRGKKGGVRELTLDRDDFSKSTVRTLETTGERSPHGEPGYAYDRRNKIIGGGVANNRFYAFDPRTRRWTSREVEGGKPGSMNFHAVAYDPVDGVFVFIARRRTWAYRYGPPEEE